MDAGAYGEAENQVQWCIERKPQDESLRQLVKDLLRKRPGGNRGSGPGNAGQGEWRGFQSAAGRALGAVPKYLAHVILSEAKDLAPQIAERFFAALRMTGAGVIRHCAQNDGAQE